MKSKKRKILIVVLVILILIVLSAAIYLVINAINQANDKNNYNNLASSYAASVSETKNTEITSPTIDEGIADNPIDFTDLKKQNEDIYGWIYFPNTNINYPVCQSGSDDNFYLDHDVYGNYSYSGSIYFQHMNSRDFSDRVTVLYGHNMANGSMFADLHKFEDTDYFNSHKYFYIYTPTNKLTYEIVSSFIYDDRHIMNSFNFNDDKVFNEYLEMIKNPRSLTKNVRDDVSLSVDDSKIVTLSTCLNTGEGRYLVQGVMTKNEKTH